MCRSEIPVWYWHAPNQLHGVEAIVVVDRKRKNRQCNCAVGSKLCEDDFMPIS